MVSHEYNNTLFLSCVNTDWTWNTEGKSCPVTFLLDSVRRELRRQNEYDKKAKFFHSSKRRKNYKKKDLVFLWFVSKWILKRQGNRYMISEPPGTFFGQLRKTNGLSFFSHKLRTTKTCCPARHFAKVLLIGWLIAWPVVLKPEKNSWPDLSRKSFIYGLPILVFLSFSFLCAAPPLLSSSTNSFPAKGQILRAHFSEWPQESAELILKNSHRQIWESQTSSTLSSHFTTELDNPWKLSGRHSFPS